MNCKNCTYQLKDENKFCSNCGAKIIHNRLTLKNLCSEFLQRFFNYDNTFFKTVRHMLTQPEVVIESFINGSRKKYINPLNFFLISLAITGLYNFLYKSFLLEETMAYYETAFGNMGGNNEFSDSMLKPFYFFLEYFNLFAFAAIPINALITKITFFNYRQHNFTEHIIINLYTVSQYQLVVYLFSIPLLFLSIEAQTILSFVLMFSFWFYFFYVFTRIYKLNAKQLFLKIFIIFIMMIGLLISIFILGIVFGVLLKYFN